MAVSKRLRHEVLRRDESALYADLHERADGELLIAWSAALPALDSPAVTALESTDFLFTYRAGRPRSPYAYLVGLHEPGDVTERRSELPPPSIQAQATWAMYARRDRHVCHLCGRAVMNDWRRPAEFQSLDHFVPRSKGGTDYPSNIRLAHVSCNKGRRDRDVVEFRTWLAGKAT